MLDESLAVRDCCAHDMIMQAQLDDDELIEALKLIIFAAKANDEDMLRYY